MTDDLNCYPFLAAMFTAITSVGYEMSPKIFEKVQKKPWEQDNFVGGALALLLPRSRAYGYIVGTLTNKASVSI